MNSTMYLALGFVLGAVFGVLLLKLLTYESWREQRTTDGATPPEPDPRLRKDLPGFP